MDYLLEILALFGALVCVMGMVTCMTWGGFSNASKSGAEPIESEESFYKGFEGMKNPFFETQNTTTKDATLKLAEEMDKEKDRMDV